MFIDRLFVLLSLFFISVSLLSHLRYSLVLIISDCVFALLFLICYLIIHHLSVLSSVVPCCMSSSAASPFCPLLSSFVLLQFWFHVTLPLCVHLGHLISVSLPILPLLLLYLLCLSSLLLFVVHVTLLLCVCICHLLFVYPCPCVFVCINPSLFFLYRGSCYSVSSLCLYSSSCSRLSSFLCLCLVNSVSSLTPRFSFYLVFFVSGWEFWAKEGNEEVISPALRPLQSVSADQPGCQSGLYTVPLLPPAGVWGCRMVRWCEARRGVVRIPGVAVVPFW